jgi:hypothetical protein
MNRPVKLVAPVTLCVVIAAELYALALDTSDCLCNYLPR